MNPFFKFASALLASTLAVAPTMARPLSQSPGSFDLAQQEPTVAPVSTLSIGGLPPDFIRLRFIGGRTLEVSNPSRAVGGKPHEVVAVERGMAPPPCQAWRPIAPPQGFGFAAEITETCGR
ncbi:MAG: hypothetical protein RJB24_234 [Candidatus Parcubacteria bacterium]|jgi:hypothetical protein